MVYRILHTHFHPVNHVNPVEHLIRASLLIFKHLRQQYAQLESSRVVQHAQVFDQAGFVNCPDLVERDLAVFSCERAIQSGRIILNRACQRRYQNSGQITI